MKEGQYIEKNRQFILNLYAEGLRASQISAMLNHVVSSDAVQTVILEEKKKHI